MDRTGTQERRKTRRKMWYKCQMGRGGVVEKEERAQNELNISETSNRISRRMGHAIWQLGDFGDSTMMALLRHDPGFSGLQMNGSREV